MQTRRILTLAALLCLPLSALASAQASKIRTVKDPIPGRYIVVLEEATTYKAATVEQRSAAVEKVASQIEDRQGAVIGRRFSEVLPGFVAILDASQLAELAEDPRVAYIEPDQAIALSATQNNPPWHLDRLDQPDPPLDGVFQYEADGSGVNIYVVDTGVYPQAPGLSGRVIQGFTAYTGATGAPDHNACNMHGTWVSQAAAGTAYGTAKAATVTSVRVLGACPSCGGSGGFIPPIPAKSLKGNEDTGEEPIDPNSPCFSSLSNVIAGLNWIRQNHAKPAVVNISLGTLSGTSESLALAVQAVINAGITVVVAAGNTHLGSPDPISCNHSPSNVSAAITVGATNVNDGWAGFSKSGSCVDLAAPGQGLVFPGNFADGTSFSSPQVAGVAAQFLQGNPQASPAQVHSAIVSNAVAGRISGVPPATPNLLLNSEFISAPSVIDDPPVADFTFACQGSSCSFDGTISTDDHGITWCVFNYGDGSPEDSFAPPCVSQHTFATSQTYEVRLTVFDAPGQHHSKKRYPAVTANPVEVSFAALDDAFNQQENPTASFGQSPYLYVRSSHLNFGRHSYLRFNVAPLSGPVIAAKIRLKALGMPVYNLRLYDMDYDAWSENTLTWNDSPLSNGPYTFLHETSAIPASSWAELDASSVVLGPGVHTFGLTAAMNVEGRGFWSGESNYPPELVLTIQP